MFIQSCPWSGRVSSSTSTINQNPPALFHFPDSAQADDSVSFLGVLTRLVRYVVTCLTAGATNAFACCCSGVRVVRLTCLGVPAPRPTASLLVGLCSRKVLSGQDGSLRLVSWSLCLRHVSRWVGGVIFCKKASAKESRDQIIGVRQSGVDSCVHPTVRHCGCQAACALASA